MGSTFVLLLVMSVISTTSGGGSGVHTEKIEGFTSRNACQAAGQQATRELAQTRQSTDYALMQARFSCIEKK